MKKITLLFSVLLFLVTGAFSQTPNEFKYQAVLRDATGQILNNADASVDISILQGSENGVSIFSEHHTVTTNTQGLINLNIGSISDLTLVNWSSDIYFIEISVNGTVMGTSQLLSVPYALHSKTAETANYNSLTNKPEGTTPGEMLYWNGTEWLNVEIGENNQILTFCNGVPTWTTDGQCPETPEWSCGDPISDIENNQYGTVQIGNQCWISDNLKSTQYSDGTSIPFVNTLETWALLGNNNTDKAYCYYDDNSNGQSLIFGALYTYAAATNGNNTGVDVQGICPEGWHIPTNTEWVELTTFLGGTDIAGGKLKQEGTELWSNPNVGATNESGFTFLPGGYRHSIGGTFNTGGYRGNWWGTNESTFDEAQYYYIYNDSAESFQATARKSHGFSVRCIQD